MLKALEKVAICDLPEAYAKLRTPVLDDLQERMGRFKVWMMEETVDEILAGNSPS